MTAINDDTICCVVEYEVWNRTANVARNVEGASEVDHRAVQHRPCKFARESQ
jgi:hypothetical protein